MRSMAYAQLFTGACTARKLASPGVDQTVDRDGAACSPRCLKVPIQPVGELWAAGEGAGDACGPTQHSALPGALPLPPGAAARWAGARGAVRLLRRLGESPLYIQVVPVARGPGKQAKACATPAADLGSPRTPPTPKRPQRPRSSPGRPAAGSRPLRGLPPRRPGPRSSCERGSSSSCSAATRARCFASSRATHGCSRCAATWGAPPTRLVARAPCAHGVWPRVGRPAGHVRAACTQPPGGCVTAPPARRPCRASGQRSSWTWQRWSASWRRLWSAPGTMQTPAPRACSLQAVRSITGRCARACMLARGAPCAQPAGRRVPVAPRRRKRKSSQRRAGGGGSNGRPGAKRVRR